MINKKNLGNLNKRMSATANGGSSGSGSSFSVMDWKQSGKEDIKFYKPVQGKNKIDIVPYEIKTKNHPMVRSGDSEIGDADYVFEVWQHGNIGPGKKTVLCLNRMYGKACPICEAASALRKAGKDSEAKKLYAKQRAFYNVIDSKEPDTTKVFEVSYKLFEKELIEEAKDDENGFTNFANPTEEGSSVKFRAEEEDGGDFKFLKFKSFSFIEREDSIPDENLEQAISFDECLKVPTYDEVLAIFNGDDDDDDEPVKAKKSNHDDEEDDDDEPVKAKKSKHDDDDDDDDEKPAKKSKKVEDDDDDEKPAKNCSKCPFGHKFGADNDNFADCDDCKCWADCSDAQE